jgi:hypothetical protein
MSIWKNIITFGNFGRLEDDIKIFAYRRSILEEIVKEYDIAMFSQKKAFTILNIEREKAIKNLALFKSIIKKIKKNVQDNIAIKVRDKKTDSNNFINYGSIQSFRNNLPDLNVDEFSDVFFIKVQSSISALGAKKEIDKNDLIIHGADVAISAMVNFLSATISINRNVIEKRRLIKDKTLDISDSVKSIKDSFPIIYAETNRVGEIALLLNKNNFIFTGKFIELNLLVHSKSHFYQFIDFLQDIRFDANEDVKKKIIFLGQICSEYNKINVLKV